MWLAYRIFFIRFSIHSLQLDFAFLFTARAYFTYDSIVLSLRLRDSPFIDIHTGCRRFLWESLAVPFFIYEFFDQFKVDFIVAKTRFSAVPLLHLFDILHQILQGFRLEFYRNTIQLKLSDLNILKFEFFDYQN